jgi:hypothetical protein
MEWSTETPKRPGYYWARTKDEKGGEGELVLVQFDGSLVAKPGDKSKSSAVAFDEWLGPIAEPKKPVRIKEKALFDMMGWTKEAWINKGIDIVFTMAPVLSWDTSELTEIPMAFELTSEKRNDMPVFKAKNQTKE